MKRNVGWVALMAALVYGANFWGPSVYILDEAKNAGCALEMWQSGNWVVPYFNGELRTDKPPLHYFFMMLAYSVFGVAPFAARLFSVVCGVLLVVHAYVFTAKHFGRQMAWVVVLILLSSLQLAIQFHLAVPDPYLILCFFSGLLFFYEGYQGEPRSLYLFYAACALGFLAKGLVAVVFPGLIVLLFLVIQKQLTLTHLRTLKLPSGILIFCAIAVPWYLAVGMLTDGLWLEGFFLKHNLSRYTQTMEGHRGFPFAPFVILLAGLLPASLFAGPAVRLAWRTRRRKPFLLLCICAVVVVPAFFSFSKTLLPGYPAPALPFLAILLAFYFQNRFLPGMQPRAGHYVLLVVHVLIVCAIPVATYFALQQELPGWNVAPVAGIFIPLAVTGALGLLFYHQKKRRNSFLALTGGWVITSVLFFWVAFPAVDKTNAVVNSSAYVREPVAYYKDFNPAYRFRLTSNLPALQSAEAVTEFLESGGTVITQARYLDELDTLANQLVFSQKDLFEKQVTVVVRKRN
ncbi:MAG: glycosyltransferase family 39 protein [Cytophagales bacterium]|nr:glycosyltransferase family 39 protein [Cytophagales bacterium]